MGFTITCDECRHDFYNRSWNMPSITDCSGCMKELCEECDQVKGKTGTVYCSDECRAECEEDEGEEE